MLHKNIACDFDFDGLLEVSVLTLIFLHLSSLQFSNHKELKTDQTHSNASASAQAALQAAQALIGQDGQVAAAGGLQGTMSPKLQPAATANHNGHGASGGKPCLYAILRAFLP